MRCRLVIRSVWVFGHPNIRTWEPDDPACFAETVSLDIGDRANDAADTFSIRVATPAGLAGLAARDGIVAIRPLLVMERYDVEHLWRWLEHTVERCERPSWLRSVEALRRYFDWEYDDQVT